VAVFVGSVSGNYHWTSVAVAAAWALAAGILVSISTEAADLGVVSLVTVVVFQAFPSTWQRGLYFKGSARDISLVPHSQEYEKCYGPWTTH